MPFKPPPLSSLEPEKAGRFSPPPLDSIEPEKKAPTFASRLYENTIKPVEDVSDAIQGAMRSQNPAMALLESAGRGARNVVDTVANTSRAKAGDPLGGVMEAVAAPVITAGRDLIEGNLGAAAGGAAGLMLPFLPKAGRVAMKAGPVVSDTARGLKAGAMAPAAMPTISVKGVPIQVEAPMPASVAGGVGGAMTGHFLGGTPGAVIGGVGGAAYPAVKGAISAIQEGIAARRIPPVVEAPPKPKRAPRKPRTKAPPEAPTEPPAEAAAQPEAAPDTPMTEQELAAELNTQPTPKPPPVQHEAAARAKKVWGITDLLDNMEKEIGRPIELDAMGPKEWKQLVDALNAQNLEQWGKSGGRGRRPDMHAPPTKLTVDAIMQEMEEIRGRRPN